MFEDFESGGSHVEYLMAKYCLPTPPVLPLV